MVVSNKVLTVTYGTFSCTLEGFDDPFTTLQMVAEYFRKLAAEDRHFGGVPQMPDTETLRRIAEENNPNVINAEVGENGIVLRQAAAAAAPFADEYAKGEAKVEEPDADFKEDTAADSTKDTDAPLVFDSQRNDAADDKVADEADTETEDHETADHRNTLKKAGLLAAAVAGPLTFFRSSRPHDEVEDEADEEDKETEAAIDDDTSDQDDSDQEEPAEAPVATSRGRQKSVEETLAAIRLNVRRAESEIALADGEDDSDAEEDDDEVAEDTSSEDTASEAEHPETTAEEPLILTEAIAEDAVAEEDEIDTPDEDAAAKAQAEANGIDAIGRAIEAALGKEANSSFAAETAEDEPEAVEPEAAEADAIEEDATEEVVAAEVETADPDDSEEETAFVEDGTPRLEEAEIAQEETAEALETETPETAEISEEEIETDAEAEPAAPSSLTPEEEDELARDLEAAMAAGLDDADDTEAEAEEVAAEAELDQEETAEVAAELGAQAEVQPETEMPEEEAAEAAERARVEAHRLKVRRERAAALLANTENETASGMDLDRLLTATQTKMDKPEQIRRINALDQLKAAVAATEAEKQINLRSPSSKDELEDETAADLAAYRDDLRRATDQARMGRLHSTAAPRPEQPPLILVSEQRIDNSNGLPQTDQHEAPREVAETDGNLALKRDFHAEPAQEDEYGEIQGIPADAFAEATDFEDFVERIGAFDLQELLEAAAAYTSIVEGKTRFSRAQVMTKLAKINTHDAFSKEAGLRAFGKLLREGKILRVQDGQFAISKASRFSIASRFEE